MDVYEEEEELHQIALKKDIEVIVNSHCDDNKSPFYDIVSQEDEDQNLDASVLTYSND